MNQKASKSIITIAVIILVLFIDQLVKYWIKTHMAIGDEFNVIGEWFRIHFVENNGMAFGIEAFGKLFLSLFRIIAVIVISFYIAKLIRENYKTGFIVCIALIFAGAFGNIIDSVFYGMIFEASTPEHVAAVVPWGEGYSSLFHGKVVDMFYFPVYREPLAGGGEHVYFFNFIFNIADAAISVGVAILIFFYRKTLSYSLMSKEEKAKHNAEIQNQNSEA